MEKTAHVYEELNEIVYLIKGSPTSLSTSVTVEDTIAILHSEKRKIEKEISSRVFALVDENHIRTFIRNHHNYLVALLRDVYKNTNSSARPFKKLVRALVECIEELLSFFSINFPGCVSKEEFVPVTHLIRSRNELSTRIELLRPVLTDKAHNTELSELVLTILTNFAKGDQEKTTFRSLIYMKELVSELERISLPQKVSCVYSALTELLVKLNFNHISYVDLFTSQTADQVNALDSPGDRLQRLVLLQKEFDAMHVKADTWLCSDFPPLKKAIGHWFYTEISHAEMSLLWYIDSLPGMSDNYISQRNSGTEKQETGKVKFNLSGDQINIVLRALDEEKVIEGPSTSAIYRIVVPYLSSREREALSWKSMRGKNNEFEERDKQIVVAILKKVVQRIEEYYIPGNNNQFKPADKEQVLSYLDKLMTRINRY